jgi:uncharacterized membrane protein YgcG
MDQSLEDALHNMTERGYLAVALSGRWGKQHIGRFVVVLPAWTACRPAMAGYRHRRGRAGGPWQKAILFGCDASSTHSSGGTNAHGRDISRAGERGCV